MTSWEIQTLTLAVASYFYASSGAPYTNFNKRYNMNNRVGELDARKYGFDDPGRKYFPSPDDWRRHAVYQVVVDRFNDGDPRNNAQVNGSVFDWVSNTGPFGGFDIRDITTRQGGDWKGLLAKLDYIQGLGARVLWISPVQQNADNSPMGYLQVDKTLLERRFGNLDDFRLLVDEVHKRGMYVVVDVVNNHLAEMLDWVTTDGVDKQVAFRMHKGGGLSDPSRPHLGKELEIRPKAKVLKACEMTPGCNPNGYQPYIDFPFDNQWFDDGKYPGKTYREHGFAGMPLGIEDLNGTGGFWKSNFHHSGEMPESEEGPWNWPLGKLYGTLDDLRTTDDDVVDKLIAASVSMIAALDIDGFRLDTPRECSFTSWTRWRQAVDTAAKKIGKNNFGTWGELWSTPERAATYMGRGKDIPQYFYEGTDEAQRFINPEKPIFDGLINYNYWNWLVAVFREGWVNQTYMAFNILEWETTLGYDLEWPSFPVNRTDKVPRYQMWNFCGSHDQHRFTQFKMGYERSKLCYAWLYTWPGIPITYQGDEQALNTPGSGLAYWGREFMASSVAWREMPTERTVDGKLRNPADANNFDQTNPFYRFHRRLLSVRDMWWDSSFACLGAAPEGIGLPEKIDCHSSTDGSPLEGIFAYRRTCSIGTWGVVVLLNMVNLTNVMNCEGIAEHPNSGTVYDVMRKVEGMPSYDYATVPDLSRIVLLPFETAILVDKVKQFRPEIEQVRPQHDQSMPLAIWIDQRIEVRFTEPVVPESVVLRIDGKAIEPTSWEDSNRLMLLRVHSLRNIEVPNTVLKEGIHHIRVEKAESVASGLRMTTPHEFRVRVGSAKNPIVGEPLRVDHDIIVVEDNGDAFIEHPAIGAHFFRVQNAGSGRAWDKVGSWRPLGNSTRTLIGDFEFGVPIIVQYHVDGSSAYMVTACRESASRVCSASFYRKGANRDAMQFRGKLNQWSDDQDWTFKSPGIDSGDHNWTLDVYAMEEDTDFIIDILGDQSHLVGRGNAVTNPFFFPFETFCFGGLSQHPKGDANWMCSAPLPGPLKNLNQNLCACDMPIRTLFLGHSGLEHMVQWEAAHYPEFWHRTNAEGENVFHGLAQYVSDASSGLYNLLIPSSVCSRDTSCRIIFNDLSFKFSIAPSPPGVHGVGYGTLDIATLMCTMWCIVPLFAVLVGLRRRQRFGVVTVFAPEGCSKWGVSPPLQDSTTIPRRSVAKKKFGGHAHAEGVLRPRKVLVASVEHVIVHAEGVDKVVAGGLGKVAGLLCQHHPGPLVCVHPWRNGQTYACMKRIEPLHAVVCARPMTCEVYKYEKPAVENRGVVEPPVTFYVVDHPLFRNRDDIYPAPQTRKKTLMFYSLWNQAVSRMIDRVHPDVYHCPDFHAGMAMMYVETPLPMVVVLHNAEYQGAISTQHMGSKEADWFADIFDLPPTRIQNELFHEGKFCMLKPAVDHVRKYQQGFGICAVSRNYALEAAQKHALLWGLPEVRGIENCMSEEERADASSVDGEDFARRKIEAKLQVQRRYGLSQNADARIFVFLGRWVKQKGVDYIADVAEWMLTTYSGAQLIMIGPVGDPYGTYAKEKLERLYSAGKFNQRMFIHADFMKVCPEIKLACDFCLMPSRDEPFGYVDIEFGWYGALVVGSLRGGLGKLPGFYFQILNSDSSKHMQGRLKAAIQKAMACDSEFTSKMSVVARRSCFPVDEWQEELSRVYSTVLQRFDWEAVGSSPPPPVSCVAALSTPYAAQFPAIGAEFGSEKSNRSGGCRSVLHTHRSFQSQMSHLSTQRSIMTARSVVSTLVAEIEREDMPTALADQTDPSVGIQDCTEFLWQEVAEVDMQIKVEQMFTIKGRVESAGALLEEVEWELQLARETCASARFLGKRIFNAPLMDWTICLCYMSGPLVAALPIIQYSEVALCYFVVDPVTQAVSLVVWTALARHFSPNKLMACACLSRLVLLALPLISAGPWTCAAAVGLIVPSDYLFIYYSFMGSSVGDIAKIAVRTGLVLAIHEEWEWVFKGASVGEHAQETIALSAAILFSLLPALALWKAPKLYREFRIPSFEFSWILKLRFLQFLGLGCLIQSLAFVSQSAVPVLRQTYPYHLEHRQMYFIALGLATLVPIAILALVLQRSYSYAMVIVKGLACFSLPAVVLRVWAHYEINHAASLTMGLDVLIFVSTSLGALSVFAVAVSVLATVGSRWRFVSYTALFGVLSNVGRVLSFFMVWWKTGHADPLNSSYRPQQLAWELLVVTVPPCFVATAFRIASFCYFDKEATSMLRTSLNRRLEWLTRSKHSYSTLDELSERMPAHCENKSKLKTIEASPVANADDDEADLVFDAGTGVHLDLSPTRV